MIKHLGRIFSAALLCFLLSGCQTTVFGVPKDTWNTLTPAQQNQAMENYNQQQQMRAVTGIINATSGLIQSTSTPNT